MNLDYKKAYTIYENINWCFKSDLIGSFVTPHLDDKFYPQFNHLLTIEFKRLFPRRKIYNLQLLPKDVVDDIKDIFIKRALAYSDKRFKQVKLLRNILDTIANTTVIEQTCDMYMVKSSQASTYRSQGWGSNKYAMGAIRQDYDYLKELGYNTEIRKFPEWNDPKCDSYRYELWVNLENWQYDCIKRRRKFDLLRWAIGCWKSGVNPRVYNPFLDNKTFDMSLELSRPQQKAH